MKHIFVLCSLVTFLASCESEPEQTLEQINQKNAREVTLSTVTNGDSVYHITKQNIWFMGEQIATKIDTVVTPNKVSVWGSVDSNVTLSKVPIYVTVQ